MKIFVRLALILTVAACVFTDANAASKGEKTFGVRTGYVSRNNSADVGLFFQYTFSRYFRLQPSADIIFRHNDRDAYTIDLNAQVPIELSGDDKFSLYPYGGLNFSSWNHHFYSASDSPEGGMTNKVSSRSNYFGVNLGAGFDLKITSTLKISIEAGYTFVKKNSGVSVLAGIGYVF